MILIEDIFVAFLIFAMGQSGQISTCVCGDRFKCPCNIQPQSQIVRNAHAHGNPKHVFEVFHVIGARLMLLNRRFNVRSSRNVIRRTRMHLVHGTRLICS